MGWNTNRREEYTSYMISASIRPSAAQEWKQLVTRLNALIDKLAHYPAMALNLQQTCVTPAKSKNKVYLMWDFIRTTITILHSDPQQSGRGEQWKDAKSRAGFARMLMLDQIPGMLDQMTESTYPSQKGAHPEFGEEVLEIAQQL